MKKINENSKCIIYLVDDEDRLIGSLTDGDIRSWILKTSKLTVKAIELANKKVKYIGECNRKNALDFMQKMNITSVPIVDEERHIKDIVFLDEIPLRIVRNKSLASVPIIIMAGGKGMRLRPYTKILPKPLIPINDVPIIERIMDLFYRFGGENFYITLNYHRALIKAFFSEVNLPYHIHFVEESEPMGTAGSIGLIKDNLEKPVIITNCDTIINADYGEIYEFHKNSKNEMTIVVARKNTVIPYGVFTLDKSNCVESMCEKPEIKHMINTGFYIVNPRILNRIPQNIIYNMPNLVEDLLKEGRKIGTFIISEDNFLDMGELEKMGKMEEKLMSME